MRERILADLGRRRMLLQAQIDELRAGRDRLLDSYRVVKRTLNDATEALVQVEARAAQELAGPPPALEVPPVDGELAALAGELTGEAGPISPDVESLFARLREQSGPPGPDDELPAPGPAATDAEPEPEPEASSTSSSPSRSAAEASSHGASRPTTSSSHPSGAAVRRAQRRRAATERPDAEESEASERTASRGRRRPRADAVTSTTPTPAPVGTPCCSTLQRELGRKVKRTLQDEQNDVLDRIRTVKGRPVALDVLPTTAAQVTALAATLRGPVDAAYGGGRIAAGAASGPVPPPTAMVDGLAATMVERLHERLVEAIDGAGRRRRVDHPAPRRPLPRVQGSGARRHRRRHARRRVGARRLRRDPEGRDAALGRRGRGSAVRIATTTRSNRR